MKMVKILFGIVLFAVAFVLEGVGYLALIDNRVDKFETQMQQYVGAPVQATYYGSTSNYHEPVIIFVEGDSTKLNAALAEGSSHRFDERLSYDYSKVSCSKAGDQAVKACSTIGQIFIALAAFTFIGFIMFIVKIK